MKTKRKISNSTATINQWFGGLFSSRRSSFSKTTTSTSSYHHLHDNLPSSPTSTLIEQLTELLNLGIGASQKDIKSTVINMWSLLLGTYTEINSGTDIGDYFATAAKNADETAKEVFHEAFVGLEAQYKSLSHTSTIENLMDYRNKCQSLLDKLDGTGIILKSPIHTQVPLSLYYSSNLDERKNIYVTARLAFSSYHAALKAAIETLPSKSFKRIKTSLSQLFSQQALLAEVNRDKAETPEIAWTHELKRMVAHYLSTRIENDNYLIRYLTQDALSGSSLFDESERAQINKHLKNNSFVQISDKYKLSFMLMMALKLHPALVPDDIQKMLGKQAPHQDPDNIEHMVDSIDTPDGASSDILKAAQDFGDSLLLLNSNPDNNAFIKQLSNAN